MKKIFTPRISGALVSNLLGFIAITINSVLHTFRENVMIYSEFVIIPMLMGIICAWFWRDLKLYKMELFGNIWLNCLLTIVLSALVLHEGVICLIIVSPLLLLFMTIGAFIGRAMFKKNNQTLNVSVVSVLLFMFISDSLSTHEFGHLVSDQAVINAPVSKVWPHVVAFKRIQQKDKYWLFRIGLPSPVQSTVEGYYLGAKRKCIFSNGYVFDEKIVTYEPDHNLTFDVTGQPRDPEIMEHLDLQRGQFLLKNNGDNTTTLTGNSWYRLYVLPGWYYDTWAQSIVRNVHIRVMEHIKELSEQKQ